MVLALLSIAAAWAIATLLILGVFAAKSIDDFADLVRGAMRAAVPAVWFVPAALFLQGRTLAELCLGLALLANAVRLLVGARPPHRLHLKNAPKRRDQNSGNEFFTETLPIIGGAVLLQSSVAAMIARSPIVAATLVACGSAVIAWWWSAAGHRTGGTRKGVAATLLIATALTVLQFREVSMPAIASAEPKPAAMPLVGGQVDPKDIKVLPGKTLVPGVILRPDTQPQKIEAFRLFPASRHGILPSRPFIMKFTGEYHLFPSSSERVQPDSTVLKGSPLDAVYASMSGGTIQTEAFQAMHPPLDLTNCGRIQVSLKTEEQSPGSASMHLVTTTGDLELGTEIIGLEASRQETLEFAAPAIPANLLVKAIRIVFRRDPLHRTQSTRVEVSEFRFLARF